MMLRGGKKTTMYFMIPVVFKKIISNSNIIKIPAHKMAKRIGFLLLTLGFVCFAWVEDTPKIHKKYDTCCNRINTLSGGSLNWAATIADLSIIKPPKIILRQQTTLMSLFFLLGTSMALMKLPSTIKNHPKYS